ncbi:MAG TPA: hypothetical protein VGJ81_01515 [Thermoanaerobaculia bacterium]
MPAAAQWTQTGSTVYTNGGITNVGVGTTTPAPYGLMVFSGSTNSFFGVKSTVGLAGFIMDRGNTSVASSLNFRTAGADTFIQGIGVYSSGSDFQIGNAGAPFMTITTGAKVGIGTTSPSAKLDVRGDSSTSGVFGTTSASGGFGLFGGNSGTSDDSGGTLGYTGSRTNSMFYFPAGVRGEVGSGFTGTGVLGLSPYIAVGGNNLDPSGVSLNEGDLGAVGYAVYAHGDIGASGVKYFVEPHPTDASKVIRYVALEGPEAGTYARGKSKFVNGRAVITLPDTFRTETEEGSLTVNITPLGHVDAVGAVSVVSATLDGIVAEATRDSEFSYVVFGVRKGYTQYDPVVAGQEFAPRDPGEKMPAWLNAVQKQRLIDNGTYNPDGTVNMATAVRLGWDKAWRNPHH